MIITDAVLIALIATVPAIIAAVASALALRQTVINSRKTEGIHNLINSRMSELLDSARTTAHAEGVAAGEQAQRDRQAAPTKET